MALATQLPQYNLDQSVYGPNGVMNLQAPAPQAAPAQTAAQIQHANLLSDTPQGDPYGTSSQFLPDGTPNLNWSGYLPGGSTINPNNPAQLPYLPNGQPNPNYGTSQMTPDQITLFNSAARDTGGSGHDASTLFGQGLLGGAALSAGGALGADAGAAGGTAATPTAGETAATTLPEQLSGPGVTGAGTAANSGAATDAAFGSGGATQVASGGATGAAGAGGGTAAAGTALSRLLAGNGTSADWLSVLGTGAGTALGVAGSMQGANASNALAGQLFAAGAPSRGRFEASMTPGFDPMSIPGYSGAVDTASQGLLRGLSTQGNPFGNPGGLINANKQIISGTELPAIQNYQSQNAAAGGFGSFGAAAPGAAQTAIQNQGNVWNAVGSGVGALTNPNPSLAQVLAGMGANRSAA